MGGVLGAAVEGKGGCATEVAALAGMVLDAPCCAVAPANVASVDWPCAVGGWETAGG